MGRNGLLIIIDCDQRAGSSLCLTVTLIPQSIQSTYLIMDMDINRGGKDTNGPPNNSISTPPPPPPHTQAIILLVFPRAQIFAKTL